MENESEVMGELFRAAIQTLTMMSLHSSNLSIDAYRDTGAWGSLTTTVTNMYGPTISQVFRAITQPEDPVAMSAQKTIRDDFPTAVVNTVGSLRKNALTTLFVVSGLSKELDDLPRSLVYLPDSALYSLNPVFDTDEIDAKYVRKEDKPVWDVWGLETDWWVR